MREAVRGYLSHKASLRRAGASVGEYRKRMGYFCEFADGQGVKSIRGVTVELVRDYHESMVRTGLKGSTRLSRMTTVRDFLAWAHDTGLILADVAVRVELPKPGHRLPPTPLRPDEMVRLLEVYQPTSLLTKRGRAILEVLYACGLRRAELLRLNVGDVDFENGRVFVHGKGNKDRMVPIHQTALKAVADYLLARGRALPKTAALFVTHRQRTRGKRMEDGDLAAIFRTVRKRFPKHVHPHLLRHTCAVHLLQGGADVRYVQALLGHEFPDTTSLYLGLVKDDIKRAYDLAMAGILDPEREFEAAAGALEYSATDVGSLTAGPPRVGLRLRRAN